MFVFKGLPAPAAGAIEFCDESVTASGLKLVNPVDIAWQRNGQAGHGNTHGFLHHIKQHIQRKVLEVSNLGHSISPLSRYISVMLPCL